MAKKGEIEVKGDVDYTISQFAKTISGEVIARSDCKVCASPLRKKIEKRYMESNSYKAAYQEVAKSKVDISYSAVRRHLINHFVAHERALMIKDYADSLSDILEQKYDRRQQLVERIKILQRRMYIVESMAESVDFYDTLKVVDAIKKLADTITTHEKEVSTMDRDMEPVDLLLVNLKNIIQEKLESSSNQDVNDALKDVFHKLANSVEGVLVRKE